MYQSEKCCGDEFEIDLTRCILGTLTYKGFVLAALHTTFILLYLSKVFCCCNEDRRGRV